VLHRLHHRFELRVSRVPDQHPLLGRLWRRIVRERRLHESVQVLHPVLWPSLVRHRGSVRRVELRRRVLGALIVRHGDELFRLERNLLHGI
jgi:hypothetical protein